MVDELGRVYGHAARHAGAGERPAPLGLIAHMDTAPDASGENVRPQIHEDYDGERLSRCPPPARCWTAERVPVPARD